MRTVVVTLWLWLLFAPGLALGCQCSYTPLNDDTARSAQSVFVFQLTDATLREDPLGRNHGPLVKAGFRVIEVLSGPEPNVTIEYPTSWCCGARLNVGHFYAAFLTRSEGSALVHCGNLLPLGHTFSPGYLPSHQLRSVTSGARSLSSVFGSYASSSICAAPRPPDPPKR